MADRVLPGPVDDACINEAVCIHTRKIFDSCRDKDCIEDLRVYVTPCSKPFVESAFSIRPRSAELLYVDVNVEPVSFKRGCYAVDVTYFYKVTGEAFPSNHTVTGLAVFDKRVVLFGSEGCSKIFTSDNSMPNTDQPVAVVETVDPLILGMKLVEQNCICGDNECRELPEFVRCAFDEPLELNSSGRQLRVTLGQFSIIRLERDVRIVIPSYNYCFPDKECAGGDQDDPCALFSRIPFPVEEFFPPDNMAECPCDYHSVKEELS